MSSDVEIFRRLRALEAEIGRLRALEFTPLAGTWTPVFQGTGTAGSFTYSGQTGRWVRVGNLIYVQAFVSISAISVAPTGDLQVGGLPYAARNGAGQFAGIAIHQHTFNLTAGTIDLGARIDPNTSAVYLIENVDNAGATLLPATALIATSLFIASGIYEGA